MNNEIFELTDAEIHAISGGGLIDPPASTQTALSDPGVDVPQIENNPPG